MRQGLHCVLGPAGLGFSGLFVNFCTFFLTANCVLCVCVRVHSRYDQRGVTTSSYSSYNTPRYRPHRPNSDARPFRREFRPDRSAVPSFNASSDRCVSFVCYQSALSLM